jgi:hypothetical protein
LAKDVAGKYRARPISGNAGELVETGEKINRGSLQKARED